MKNCRNIENILPLYSEGLLSASEIRDVEEHLKSCWACTRVLAQLQRSDMMVRELKEVEPPPWFKQKIMAGVREAAAKKSFAQKWFYPLRIKIPVQIMATIVIAVLAVYIYRLGDEQMKTVLPEVPQPLIKARQEPTPVEIPKAKEVAPAVPAEKKTAAIGVAKKDKMAEETISGGSVPKMERQANKLAGASDKTLTMRSDLASEKEEQKKSEIQVDQEAPQTYSARQERVRESSLEDSSLSGAAKKSKMLKAAAPAAPRSVSALLAAQPQASVLLLVDDLNTAVAEVEKVLAGYGARIKSKQLLDGRVIMQADFSGKYWKDVLSKLKVVGQVEEKNIPADTGERDINVVIEVKNQ